MRQWYAIHTNARQEANAAGHLWRQGFEIFFPRQWKRIKHARKSSMELRPYFPRYLFARSPIAGFETIRRTIGVSTIVTNNGTPMAIPEMMMGELRSRFDEDGYLPADAVPPPHGFAVGELVRISEGVFKGLNATVTAIDESKHLRVLIEIFGRPTRADMSADGLEHLSPVVQRSQKIQTQAA